ncbi:alpha/beta hydrolase [Luteococcus sp. Sow4_B9]|uniref:alpha/beta hydrolase n=1 Tax=Luteococcus sp. Sow4_B9 TaxID=3438792 RepID=UPI003F9E66B9
MGSDAQPDGFAAPPAGQGRQRYLDQKLQWIPCGQYDCASVLVPLDWDRPDGQAITLKMKRAKAQQEHKGSLFINPGGPGGSGQQMVDTFDGKSFPNHDIIGWDPRGSGDSTTVVCGTPEQTDEYVAMDTSPDDDQEWQEVAQGFKDFAAQCREGSGALLDHISTLDTVRDLDYLRHLVGDEKLDYMGISYGTYIGSLYGELYPQRVGRMVLDSAVNITDDESVIQAMGFDLALKNYAQWCAEQSCGLGGSADEVVKTITGLFDSLDAKPLAVGDRELTQSLGITGTVTYLYFGASGYPQLTDALQEALAGRGETLLETADLMNGRDAQGNYSSMTYSFPGIGCIDAEDPGEQGAKDEFPKDVAKAPILAPYFGPNLQCTWWTTKPSPQLKITAQGAAPILVLGATGDPATPYQQAVWMADQLDSGVLLTWKGAGHSAWDLGNACVKDAVRGYVNKGVVPKDATTC